MRKFFVCFSLISLLLGFTNVYASMKVDEPKPFVGKWEFWKDDCSFGLELDLYGSPTDGRYGFYNSFCEDTSMEYRIVGVSSIQSNLAEVVVEGFMGEDKAILEYNPASGNLSFKISNLSPIVFKQQDKYGFVFINGGDKINVRSTPVSGASLSKANRGQSFRFLGKENGWFKVELSTKDKRIGYISPQYASYLKDNKISEEVFTKDYSRDNVCIMFEKKGTQIVMVKTIMRPQQDGRFLPAIVENYLGEIEGNALVFTYFQSGLSTSFDIKDMSKIEPYVVYYWKESGMFIMDGKNYSADR